MTITDIARSAAAELVAREARRSGSRMTAYGAVARAIGVSASWVRKFIGASPDAKPDLVVGFNILRLFYECACIRVEQEHENERARIAALRGQIDAAFPGSGELVARAAGAAAPRAIHEKDRPPEG